MANVETTPTGPDLSLGVPLDSVPDEGVLVGHVGGVAVLLARLTDGLHAVSGTCTHYGAPLAEGLVVGEEIRCPWHHACFSLRTGAALRAPAFAPLATWHTEIVGDSVFVSAQNALKPQGVALERQAPERIVIIGGGAAGFAAAERLRELGYEGRLSMLSADAALPCDRPNLSKDYLAGTAPEEWVLLQDQGFYTDRGIDLRLGCSVAEIETDAHRVVTASGEAFPYDTLLIATGAEPHRLLVPGFARRNVFTLRSLADARAIIAACKKATSVVFIGAGFIGMEAAGALRARGLSVHVVAPNAVPMERILGNEIGQLLASIHEAHGVELHMRTRPTGFDGNVLTLEDGRTLHADIIVISVGVAPRTMIAQRAGIAVDNGILVDTQLRTSVAGIYAAGDVARYPHGADQIRIEHWTHAQRQGQTAAANMLGFAQEFVDEPFFWTHHYGLDLRCTGVFNGWDEVAIEGDLEAHDFIAKYTRNGRLIAAVTAGRDLENLQAEAVIQACCEPACPDTAK